MEFSTMAKITPSTTTDRETFNQNFAEIVLEKVAPVVQKICPDEIFYSNDKINDFQIFQRLDFLEGVYLTDYFDYKAIFDFCVQHNISRVYDIGGGYGFAQFIIDCFDLNIDYTLVDCATDFCQARHAITQTYPFKINANARDALISHLCLGMIYTPLSNREIFNQAITDFSYIIIQTQSKDTLELQKLFPYKIINKTDTASLFYFDTHTHQLLSKKQTENFSQNSHLSSSDTEILQKS